MRALRKVVFQILLDSVDPDTVIQSLTAEVKGVGRTGWVNIHTDKIFETEKVSSFIFETLSEFLVSTWLPSPQLLIRYK